MLEPRQVNEATIPGAELSHEAFRATFNARVIWRMRGAWLAAALVALAVAVVERLWLPGPLAAQLASVRVGLLVPLLVLGIVLTLPAAARRHLQWIGGGVMLLAGLVVVAMLWTVQRTGLPYPPLELLLFLVFTYFLCGLRLGVASLVGSVVTAAAVGAEVYTGSAGPLLLQHVLFLLLGNLAGIVGGLFLAGADWGRFAAERRLQALVNRDGLTGLLNRTAFAGAAERMAAEYRAGGEQRGALRVARVDVDALRAYNDLYGYAAGDAALQAVARVLGGLFHGRRAMAARLAGEGFAIVCVVPDGAQDLALFEQVRRQVQALALVHAGSPVAGEVTISVGVAAWNGELEDALAEAGQALQVAKQAGRNQVQAH